MYNSVMKIATIRRLIGVIILLLSLSILLWGLWPSVHLVQSLPVPPGEMSLPTPQGFAPGCLGLLFA